MSLITQGVLRQPLPDDPSELGVVEWMQIKDQMRFAADELGRLSGLLDSHGINPKSEYFCSHGFRHQSADQKDPPF